MPTKKSILKNKDNFLSFLYSLPLECRTYNYLSKHFNCDYETIRKLVEELNIENNIIHPLNKKLSIVYSKQINYIESFLININDNKFRHVYKNMEIYDGQNRKYNFDIVFESLIENEDNFIIQFPHNKNKSDFIKSIRQNDFINKIIYVDSNDFTDVIKIQKLKYKICKLANISFPIYEEQISDTNNLLHTFNLYKLIKNSYRDYLYINMLQDNIMQSIKNEIKYIELSYGKIFDNISNYNKELYNSQMKIKPLIKRVNRRF